MSNIMSLAEVPQYTAEEADLGITNTRFTEFAGRGQAILHEFVSEGCRYRIGPIGAFSSEEIKISIERQTEVYANKQTMGEGFLANCQENPELYDQLRDIFSEGFDKNRVVVFVDAKNPDGEYEPVGGIHIAISESRRPVLDVINGADGSSIPTLQAIRIEGMKEEDKCRLAGLEEKDIVCPTRYWTAGVDIMSRLGITDRTIAQKLVALVPVAYASYQISEGQPVSSNAIYDSHDERILGLTSREYGARIIGANGSVKPNMAVLASVLKYHYGREPGFEGKIGVGLFDTKVFLERALENLRRWDIEVDMPTYSGYRVSDVKRIQARPLNGMETGDYEAHPLCGAAEIIDTNTLEGKRRMQVLTERHIGCESGPYNEGIRELSELVERTKVVPGTEAEVLNLAVSRVKELVPDISEEDLSLALVPIVKDLTSMVCDARALLETASQDSRVVFYPNEQKAFRVLGHEAFRLLAYKTRALGLIPSSQLDELRSMKVKSMGASVAASTLHMLASMGAENLSFWDSGTIDPSNLGRLPQGKVENIGRNKATCLQEELYHMNPYGDFKGFQGNVVGDSLSKMGLYDVSYDELFAGADMILEVVDNPSAKAGVRVHAARAGAAQSLFAIVDAGGNNSMVWVEKPKVGGRFFGDEVDWETLLGMADPKGGTSPVTSVVKMVGHNLPPDHTVQLAMVRAGLIPYLSQTPIAARQSAAIIGSAIANGHSDLPTLSTIDNMPRLFMDYSPEQLQVIDEIREGLLRLEH